MQNTSGREIASFFGSHFAVYLLTAGVIYPLVIQPLYRTLLEQGMDRSEISFVTIGTGFFVSAVSWIVVFIAFILLRGPVGQEPDRSVGGF